MVLRGAAPTGAASTLAPVGTLTLHGAGVIALRTLVVYFSILVLLRLAGKRELGQMSVFDLTVILLVANAVQNAMVGADTSLLGGISAALVLIMVNFAVAVLSTRFDWLRRLVEPPPTILVRHGTIDRRAMRRELVNREELQTAAREHGVSALSDVWRATLEADGSISIVTRDDHARRRPPRKPI
jgi:uncharacterized membrane protein YcaP (DUF421 family)